MCALALLEYRYRLATLYSLPSQPCALTVSVQYDPVPKSHSMPRGGLQRKLMVRNQGGESAAELLPRASTCTDSLYLPRYASREELERKLTIAIDNTAGFWLW